MEFIVALAGSVATVEAQDEASAMTVARDRFLPTDLDKKLGNFAIVPKPSAKEGWIELRRRVCIGNGEFFENFGYLPAMYRTLEEFLDAEVKRAEEPGGSSTG